MGMSVKQIAKAVVTSHTGCVSRNRRRTGIESAFTVTSHTGCVSRNVTDKKQRVMIRVTSHTGCVSRNLCVSRMAQGESGHIPHGMCE